MAAKKAKSGVKRERKPAAPGATRRLTHKTIMNGVEGAASYTVYGIAKKAVIQDTQFGRIPGLKGAFEAVTPGGEVLTSKRCFLPIELHGDVAKLLANGEEVAFGAKVSADGDSVKSEFFAEPAPTDPMANLREDAKNA